MTCILALENSKMNETVKFSARATALEPTKLYARTGETFYMRDLLYSLMVPSHNDTAAAIAEHISGSQSKFVSLMNKKAAQLGCTDTHFATPNGLDAGYTHYTTVSDLAKNCRVTRLRNLHSEKSSAPKVTPSRVLIQIAVLP